MNIAFIYQKGDPYVDERVEYFHNKGHNVYKLNYGSSNSYQLRSGIKTFNLNEGYCLIPNFIKRFIHYFSISRFCRNYSIDILHVGNMLSSFYLLFPTKAKKIIENEGSDVLVTPIKYPIIKPFYKFIYPFADGIVQDSHIAQLCGIKYGASKYNNKIIKFGIDFKLFNSNVNKGIARKELELSDERIVLSSRGHKDIYNLDIILKSIPYVLKTIPNTFFVFTCLKDGFIKKYKHLIKSLNIQNRVIILDYLDHKLRMPFYSVDSDLILSVPSSDSNPASVYEAIACKTPVIISDLPWVGNIFIKGKEVIVVPSRNVQKLAQAIIEVLSGIEKVDSDSAYRKIYKLMNYESENKKLESFYNNIYFL